MWPERSQTGSPLALLGSHPPLGLQPLSIWIYGDLPSALRWLQTSRWYSRDSSPAKEIFPTNSSAYWISATDGRSCPMWQPFRTALCSAFSTNWPKDFSTKRNKGERGSPCLRLLLQWKQPCVDPLMEEALCGSIYGRSLDWSLGWIVWSIQGIMQSLAGPILRARISQLSFNFHIWKCHYVFIKVNIIIMYIWDTFDFL